MMEVEPEVSCTICWTAVTDASVSVSAKAHPLVLPDLRWMHHECQATICILCLLCSCSSGDGSSPKLLCPGIAKVKLSITL